MKINLDFYNDGSVIVRQERDYEFIGSFTYAYLDVLKKDVKDVKFLGIVDLDTNESLSYDLQDDSNHVKATWYYTANYQTKRFLIVYKIEGAVKRYNDVAEFYWKVIEDEHESIDSFESYVNLPSKSPNLFKILVHSSASPGKIDFLNDLQTAKVTMQSIPSNTFVEFRVLTDSSIFTEVQQISQNKYQDILNEESLNLQVSSFTHSLLFYLIAVIIIPLIIFFYFYLRYGREPKVDYQLKYEQEPPRDMPPMALSSFYGGGSYGSVKGLLATILDLARRGFIDIREEKKVRRFAPDKDEQIFKITKKGREALSANATSEDVKSYKKGNLLSFEKKVLSLLFEGMSKKEDEISSSEISKWCVKNRYKMQDILSSTDSSAKHWFEENYFKMYEPKSLKKSGKIMLIFIPYFFLVIIFLIFNAPVQNRNFKYIIGEMRLLAIFLSLAFFIAVIAAHAINKRTPQAALEMKKWKAFKNYISDFSAMKDAPLTLLHIWDRYLVYAVVLGVAKQLLENIKDISLERHAQVAAVAWYHPIGTPGIPKGMMSPEAFSAFSSNMNGMISALSSSSSVGGGFSGGGGGGGGGGGSGAG
jgi:uncharacterized membrane protein